MNEDDYTIGKEDKDEGLTILNVTETPLMALIPPQHEMFPVHVRWVEDDLVPYRWYHARIDWFKLWWMQWRRGEQPFTGFLCPLLGRHWFPDWRKRVTIMENWTRERMIVTAICQHCGASQIIRTQDNDI